MDGVSARVETGTISQKPSVPINGVQQGMVIPGEDVSDPVLLWVHGGPGLPDYPPSPSGTRRI